MENAFHQLDWTPPPVSAPPPCLYGGHRGGGRRRKDGLCAGSPEAIAADRAKDAERKRRSRETARAASLPAMPYAPPEDGEEFVPFACPPVNATGKGPFIALGIAVACLIAGHVALCSKLDQLNSPLEK